LPALVRRGGRPRRPGPSIPRGCRPRRPPAQHGGPRLAPWHAARPAPTVSAG